MDVKINTTEMRNIADNIRGWNEEIWSIVVQKVRPILESSKDCLTVSGLSYDEVITSFNNVFDTLDNQLSSLSEVLTNKIIPKYEQSENVVANMFNKDFAAEMTKLMGEMNK